MFFRVWMELACFAGDFWRVLGESGKDSPWKPIVTLTRFLHRKEHPCTADLLMCALLKDT